MTTAMAAVAIQIALCFIVFASSLLAVPAAVVLREERLLISAVALGMPSATLLHVLSALGAVFGEQTDQRARLPFDQGL
jgi:hypothetical protein